MKGTIKLRYWVESIGREAFNEVYFECSMFPGGSNKAPRRYRVLEYIETVINPGFALIDFAAVLETEETNTYSIGWARDESEDLFQATLNPEIPNPFT